MTNSVSVVLETCKSNAGDLLRHHVKMLDCFKQDATSLERVYGAWKKEINLHFNSFDTSSIVELIKVTMTSLTGRLLSAATGLIMKLYRRNKQLEGQPKNEGTLAKELLKELLERSLVASNTPLQHLIVEKIFVFPKPQKDFISHVPYDSGLMKMLLESGILVNEVDGFGNTMLHYAVRAYYFDVKKISRSSNFNEQFISRAIKTMTLLLEGGVYPNARNTSGQMASEAISQDRFWQSKDAFRRMNDTLKHYEEKNCMTLKHQAAVAVREWELPYQEILPTVLVKFVNLIGDECQDSDSN